MRTRPLFELKFQVWGRLLNLLPGNNWSVSMFEFLIQLAYYVNYIRRTHKLTDRKIHTSLLQYFGSTFFYFCRATSKQNYGSYV